MFWVLLRTVHITNVGLYRNPSQISTAKFYTLIGGFTLVMLGIKNNINRLHKNRVLFPEDGNFIILTCKLQIATHMTAAFDISTRKVLTDFLLAYQT